MNWIVALVIGLILGYLISLAFEWYSWQDKRVCVDAEDQLRTQVSGLESRNSQLEADYSTYEQTSVKLADTESQLRMRDTELSKVQGRMTAVEKGDLSGISTKGWNWGKLAAVGGAGALAGYVAKDSKEYKDSQTKISTLQRERDDFAKQLKTAKSDTSASDKLNAKIKTLEVERNNLNAKVGTLEKDKKSLNAKIGTLEADTSTADVNASLRTRIGELEGERDSLNARIGSIEGGDLSTVNTKGWDLGKFGLAAGAGALAGYVATDSDDYKGLQAQVDSVSAERDGLAARIAAMEADTSGSDLSASLNARIADLEGERDGLNAKIGDLEADTSAADVNASLRARISELEGERDGLNTKVGTLEAATRSADVNADLNASLNARIVELEGERDGLNARIGSIESGDLTTVDTKGWDLGKFGLAAGAGALAGYVATDSDDYKGLQAQIDSVSAERDDLAARLAAQEADTTSADLSARISSLEGERDGLQVQLDAAAADTSIADLQARNATLTGERNGLQAKLDAAAADTSVADLQARNAALEGERNSLSGNLDASTTQISSLEARIAELEGKNKANIALAAAAAATAGGAGYFTGRDWRKLEVGTPGLGNFSIDATDTATGKFTLSGTGEPNADIAVQVGETVVGRAKVGDDTNWTFSEVIKIPAGVHEVWARMIDTEDGRTAMDAKSRSIKLQRRPAKPAQPAKPDDLTKLWGIGPKFNELLQSKGINTFVQLANTDVEIVRTIIKESDMKARLANEETWAEQARLAAAGDWKGLKALTSDYAERRRSGEFGDD